jgi:actin-like ATPase involved in cell morphogenesis
MFAQPDALKNTPPRYVLTVPSNWSDAAKDITKKCAKAAFGSTARVDIILEPYAAALHVLKSDAISTLVKDGHYVVCDAGGGTVDLITYQVLSDGPLKLRESARSTADVCGALLLNCKFECYLAKRLGNYYTGEAGGRTMQEAVKTVWFYLMWS